MRTEYCKLVREQLAAFVDGELTGAERLDVENHARVCVSCARMVDELTGVGEALRAVAGKSALAADDFQGLAAGVICRTKAEAAASWRGVFHRAVEDQHWLVVGAGALAATFVTGALTSALLAFGPEPERIDSLAGHHRGAVNGRAESGERASLVSSEEAMLVDELAFASTAAGGGRSTSTRFNVDPQSRLIQEALLDEIIRWRLDEPMMVGRSVTESVAVSWAFSRRPAARVLVQ